MALYRVRYAHPDGRQSWATFASVPHDALRYAAAYVKAFVGGELLSITELPSKPAQYPLFKLN